MKKINTGFAVDPSPQQPFTTKSLDFLQDANKDMIAALCRNIISNHGLTYSSSVPYFISQYNTSFISDGAVFFNGELYILEENVTTLAYATIDTTPNATADPLLFSDGVGRNVHNNRYLTFTNTLSGSLFAIADIVNVSRAIAIIIPQWTAFTPGVSANDSSGTTVVGGYTGTMTGYYKSDGTNLYIMLRTINFSTIATVNSIYISGFPTGLTTGQVIYGGDACRVGTFPCYINMYANFSGAGTGFQIFKIDGTDFGVTSNLVFNLNTFLGRVG